MRNFSIKWNAKFISALISFLIIFMMVSLLVFSFTSCKTSPGKRSVSSVVQVLKTNQAGEGATLEIDFKKGKYFNYPLIAIWVEDTSGNYIQDLYVAQSIAKGVFRHGNTSEGIWKPGEIRRPAALPYWGHKRGIKDEDGLYLPSSKNPLPDAYTGATPTMDFQLLTRLNDSNLKEFCVLFEINQSWDWNEYWTNNKFPDDRDYKSSSQPALVYRARIDLNQHKEVFPFTLIGHSHYSGKDGSLDPDVSTITTALQIIGTIVVKTRK